MRHSVGNRPELVCIDGMNLMIVLGGQFALSEALPRKRDLAVEKRQLFVALAAIVARKVQAP